MDKIQTLCSDSVFEKSKRYETKNSIIFRTQSSADRNCINGQFKGARYHEQSVSWGRDVDHLDEQQDFTLQSIKVYCTCKFFVNETTNTGLCCSHIVGHLRRVVYLTS